MRLRSLPLLAGLGLAACAEPPERGDGRPVRDLTVPATAPAPRIPLVPLALSTQADFDALEDRYLTGRDNGELIALLERLATNAKPSSRPEDALLLMRLAVLYHAADLEARGAGNSAAGYLQKALALGTRLRSEAPMSPHTLFLQGYIPFAFLGGSAERPLVLTPDTRELALGCRDQWRGLLAANPGYDGPHDLDQALIQTTVDRLERAIGLLAPAPTDPANPTDPAAPTEPADPAAPTDPAEPADAAERAAAPAAPASRAEVEAMNLLLRYEGASEGDRTTLCNDWKPAAPGPGRSSSELLMDLACLGLRGDAARAVPIITFLAEREGPSFDACLALARLADRAPPSALGEALRSAPPTLLACSIK